MPLVGLDPEMRFARRLDEARGDADAIALAVRAEVPIFAAEDVLERAGILLDEEGQALGDELHEQPTAPTPEELEKLAPFRDFVAGLDLDDLGKGE